MPYLDIVPDTTLDTLLANNTSASSSFTGWPNGVPKPGNVSRRPIPIPQIKIMHRCDWWGGTSHPNIGVNVTDPVYIQKTVRDMHERGIDACSLLWHGSQSREHQSALLMKPETEKQGMKFLIMIGSSTPTLKLPPKDHPEVSDADRAVVLINILDFLRDNFFHSPAYLRDASGKPILMFFGVSGVDWNAVRAHVALMGADGPSLWFRQEADYAPRSYADGYFGWTSCNEAWVTRLKSLGKPFMLGQVARFDNTIAVAPVKCTWGAGHPRQLMSSGGRLLASQLALARLHPDIPYAHFATWNDYQEGSALEPGLMGLLVAGSVAANSLTATLTGTPDVVDHYEVYVSLDAFHLMKLSPEAAPVQSFQLDLLQYHLPPGPCFFFVRAVGTTMMQNAITQPIRAVVRETINVITTVEGA